MLRAVLRALMIADQAIELEDIIFHVRGQLSKEIVEATAIQTTLDWLCEIGVVTQTSPARYYLHDEFNLYRRWLCPPQQKTNKPGSLPSPNESSGP